MRHDETLASRALPDEGAHVLRIAGGFGALVGLTWLLIVLGALVRAHDAGLACPDWPLCFGEVVPRMDLRVGFEWTHRAVAGTLAFAFAGLSLAALARPATRRAAGGPIAVGAALLATQIVLGALTIWHELASWTVTAHLLTGNAFAVSLLWTALALRDAGRRAPRRAPPPPSVRALASCAAVLLVLQMALGGLVASRYAGLACPDWPACVGGVWLPSLSGLVGLHLAHRWNGVLLVLALAALFGAVAARAPRLRGIAGFALVLAVAQLGVGVANVWLRLPVPVTGLHSALATLLVLTLSLAVRESLPARGSA